MKRLLLAVLLLVAASTVSLAQSVSQSTFVAKYTSWNNHLLKNHVNLALSLIQISEPKTHAKIAKTVYC